MWTTASPRCRAARRSGESFPSSSLPSRAPHRPDEQVRRLGGRAPARRLVRGRVGRRVRVRRARRGRARPARARRGRRDRRSRRRRSRRRPRRARRGAGGRGRARGAKRARTRRERRHGFRDGVFPHPLVARGSGARGVDGARRVLRRLCERCAARPSFLARAFPRTARISALCPPSPPTRASRQCYAYRAQAAAGGATSCAMTSERATGGLTTNRTPRAWSRGDWRARPSPARPI